MVKKTSHQIVFDDLEIFYAGSKVQGYVFVQLEEPLNLRGIRILFRGTAKVRVSEYADDGIISGQRTRHKVVSGRSTEDYLNTSILLHGFMPGQGNTTIELPPGEHKFPFTFTLPLNLPASFEGTNGHVRYYAESNIDLPWKLDPKSRRQFLVRPIVDLNLLPRNRYGITGENEKNICCLCCTSGLISATFRIEQQGFVPGEAIKLYAEINNDSNKRLAGSYVNLTRTITYCGNGRKKTQSREIARISRPAIKPHGKDMWEGQALRVPPTPPTAFPGCGLMDVEYTLKLNVAPSRLLPDLEIPFDINIGTIPVGRGQPLPIIQPSAPQGNVDQSLMNSAAQSQSPMAPCYPTAPSSYDGYASAPPDENEQAQPSYQQYLAPDEGNQGNVHSINKKRYQRF